MQRCRPIVRRGVPRFAFVEFEERRCGAALDRVAEREGPQRPPAGSTRPRTARRGRRAWAAHQEGTVRRRAAPPTVRAARPRTGRLRPASTTSCRWTTAAARSRTRAAAGTSADGSAASTRKSSARGVPPGPRRLSFGLVEPSAPRGALYGLLLVRTGPFGPPVVRRTIIHGSSVR